MPSRFPGFSPDARAFLRELAANNNRDWFLQNKTRYEQSVRAPLIELVHELGTELDRCSPGYVTDPRKAVYRIYRDVRFSKDKSPYKTHAAAVFAFRGPEKHAGAGYYFHFSADELLVGGGVYAPGSAELLKIRRRIAADPDELRAIVANRMFKKLFTGIEGERLKRIPKGFPRDHPAADLLVYKQFLAGAVLPASEIESPGVAAAITKHFQAIAPFIQYLNRAIVGDRQPRNHGSPQRLANRI